MARFWVTTQGRVEDSRIRTAERPEDSLAFDYAVVALAAWHLAGVYLDGWAHQHIPSLETFFTPWYAVLYSGYVAVASVLVLRAARNWQRGFAFPRVLPTGYDLSVLGVVVFAVGGVGDLIWHSLFGIEADVEALLSPTHLALALGMTLILTGPVRAAYHRVNEKTGWAQFLPAVLALTFTLSLFAFFTQYAHPFGTTMAAGFYLPAGARGSTFLSQALGIMSILGQTALLMGIVLFALRRWRLPFGSLALMFGLSTLLMVLMRTGAYTGNAVSTGPIPLTGVAVLGGLVGDVLVQEWKPSVERPTAFHASAFAIPAVLYALYFAALEVWGGGIWWTIHMWAGAIFLAGIVGLLLSYAMLPPPTEVGKLSEEN